METTPKVVATFRKSKVEIALEPGLTVGDVKSQLIAAESSANLIPSDLKLLFKGKTIDDDNEVLSNILSGKKVYKMIAMGRSVNEIKAIQGEQEQAKQQAPRIRDDLTQQGQREAERRKRLGRFPPVHPTWATISATGHRPTRLRGDTGRDSAKIRRNIREQFARLFSGDRHQQHLG